MKKALPTLLLAACLAAALPPAALAAPFSDLAAGHWAFDHVTELAAQGIVSGYPDGRFLPDNTVTAGEFYKLMVMAADPGYVAQGPSRPYAEAAALQGEHWAYEYALRLARLCGAEAVPASGYDTPARADRVISRIDMAVLAAATHRARTGGAAPAADAAALSRFSDLAGLTEAQRADLSYCLRQGLIAGFEDGTFRPNAGLTRAQAAKMTMVVSGGFEGLPAGETAALLRRLRAVYPDYIENAGLSEAHFGLCLEALAPYLEWYPQPLLDALTAGGCTLSLTAGADTFFDTAAGRLTLAVDTALLSSAAGRQQAAQALLDGFNHAVSKVTADRVSALRRAGKLSLSCDLSADKLGEVAELCLLRWESPGGPACGPALALQASQDGAGGRQALRELETGYLLLCRLYGLSEADRAKLSPFPDGHAFTETVTLGG
ncbi:MAG: S-layer homology domain-containing protein [Clostridiales bacterium]|nr:S-layer homology domain-containing protein [Clostridiales bacterium]